MMCAQTIDIQGIANPLAEAVRQQARAVRGKPLPALPLADFLAFTQTGERAAYEEAIFARHERLALAGTAWLLDPGAETLAELADMLWQICQEPSWSLPAHLYKSGSDPLAKPGAIGLFLDLVSTDTGATVAYLTHAAVDELPPALVDFIHFELQRRIFMPFLTRDWNWLHLENNWAAVCASGVGLAALYGLPAEDKQRARIITRVATGMHSYIRGFGADGATEEGVDYWAYGFGHYVYYAQALAAETGDDHFLRAAKVPRMARFPFNASLFPGKYVMFGDMTKRTAAQPSGLMSFCAKVLHAPLAEPMRYSTLAESGSFNDLLHNIAWTDESLPVTPLPAVTDLPSVAWHIVRQPAWAFAIKAGSNHVSHNHNDAGSWELVTPTQSVVRELGSGPYTRDYFDDQVRYTLPYTRSLGHSVPYVNGTEQVYQADTLTTMSVAEDGTAVLNLTKAYPPAARLRRLLRTVRLTPQTVGITDQASFASPGNTFTTVLILPAAPTAIAGAPDMLQLAGGWSVTFPAGGQSTVTPLVLHDHDGQPYTAYRLSIQYAAGIAGEWTVQLTAPPSGKAQ